MGRTFFAFSQGHDNLYLDPFSSSFSLSRPGASPATCSSRYKIGFLSSAVHPSEPLYMHTDHDLC